MIKQEAKARIEVKARAQAEERVLDLLLPPPSPRTGFGAEGEPAAAAQNTREKMRRTGSTYPLSTNPICSRSAPASPQSAHLKPPSG